MEENRYDSTFKHLGDPTGVCREVVTGSQTNMNMDLKYPLVYTENTAVQTAINTDIAAYVGEANDAYYNRHVYQVSQSYKVTYEDKDIVSLLLTTYYYRAVAAHGSYRTRGMVYDKRTGQRVPLYNYVKIASAKQLDIAVRDGVLTFYTSARKRTYLPRGRHVDYASDNYFLIGKGYINLVYQPYELGPFSYGNTFIEFSSKAIEYFNRMNS
ncbi:MAG: hypothetical protein ACLSW9_08360 [Megasphaera micronuciformis]